MLLINLSQSHPIEPSEITPEAVFADRRRFLVKMGLATAAVALAGYKPAAADAAVDANLASLNVAKKHELAGGETVTAYEDIALVSRASSPLSAFSSRNGSRTRPGISWHRRSTGSIRM
jgi:hypothetical protein